MSRVRATFAVLLLLVLLAGGGAGPAAAAGGHIHHPPGWSSTYDDSASDPSGAGGAIITLMLLAVLGGIGMTAWKVSTARKMARRSGMNEDDAATMTLLTNDGFEATYLAANLREPSAQPERPDRSTADRLRELRQLLDEELITLEEYDQRRTAVLGEL